MMKSNAVWWGGFGLVIGAVEGGLGGGGLLDFAEGGVSTAIVWVTVGTGVGVLYGIVFGKALSARKLEGIGSLLSPGMSLLVAMAWVDAKSPLTADALDAHARPGSDRLVLNFEPAHGGVILEPV